MYLNKIARTKNDGAGHKTEKTKIGFAGVGKESPKVHQNCLSKLYDFSRFPGFKQYLMIILKVFEALVFYALFL